MTITEILALKDKAKAITLLTAEPEDLDVEKWQNEYDGEHTILHDEKRQPKTLENGTRINPARETIPFQKKVVNSSVAFLFGRPVELQHSGAKEDTPAFEVIEQAWKDNKLTYFNRKLARQVFIETRAAELWSIRTDPETKKPEVRVQLLSKKDGYDIYPHFDDHGKMDAFTIKVTVVELGEDGVEKKVEQIVVYTTKSIIRFRKDGTEWKQTLEKNPFNKIPVVYYATEKPDWNDVQVLIDRMEYLFSHHSDTNDYYSGPIAVLKGKLAQMPEKEQDGKTLVLQGQEDLNGKTEYGTIEYLTWDHSPESLKLEIETKIKMIFSMTSTPDLSTDSMKGLSDISGVALRLMFLEPILKALDNQGVFGEGMDRRISVMKAVIAAASGTSSAGLDKLEVTVKFGDPLPDSVNDLIDMLISARAGEAIISMETAVHQNPLVDDKDEEINRLKAEHEKAASIGASYEV